MNPRLEFLRVDFDNSIHCHRSQHGLLCGGGGGDRGGGQYTQHTIHGLRHTDTHTVCKTTVIGAEQAFTGDGPGGWGGGAASVVWNGSH